MLFHVHNKGIGNKLMDVVEQKAAKLSDMVYLAVGVHSGYGAAQTIYVKRGYIPDGSGVWYQGKQLEQYAPCCNDDDLLLFMSKNYKLVGCVCCLVVIIQIALPISARSRSIL